MGRKRRDFTTGDAGAAENPFAALRGLRDELPKGEVSESDQASDEAPRFAGKVIIRRERSGRGGKTVTVVEGVLLAGTEREDFLKELRRSLGTSGRSEGENLVFGGDVGDRLAIVLENAGAARIVRGN